MVRAAHPVSVSEANSGAARWGSLFRIGAGAALMMALFAPVQVVVYVLNPPPATVSGWCAFLAADRISALIDLDLLLVVDQVLTLLMFLAFYAALPRARAAGSLVGVALGLLSAILMIAINPALGLLNLCLPQAGQGALAGDAVSLAAGLALLSQSQGSAFHVSYIVGSIGSILLSWQMVHSPAFSRSTAWFGLLGNGFALGLYVPSIGIWLSLGSVVFLWAWCVLAARDLLRLARTARHQLSVGPIAA